MNFKSFLRIHVMLTLALTAMAWPKSAHADLTITPVRIVFEGRDRSAIVELINTTNTTNSYRMRWMDLKMGSSGRYELVPAKEDDPTSVSQMVMFSPRQVTIEPRGHQTIRLSLRRPPNLPNGEYRSHMAMIRLAKQGPERPDPKAKAIDMDIKVNLGFSIPVIVRSGEDRDLRISLINPKLEMSTDTPPTPRLKIDINRDSGKFSTNGKLTVYWMPKTGSEKVIGALDNMALYPELKTRTVTIPLKESPDSGSLRVTYVGKFETDGDMLAAKSFPIGK